VELSTSGGPAKAGLWSTAPLLLVLAGFMFLSLALNIANPIWEAIDEPGHFQYVKFVAEQHRLPASDADLPSLRAGAGVNCNDVRCIARGSIVSEPPLYYLLAAPFMMPLNLNSDVSWVANPSFTWWGYPLRNAAAIHTLSEAWPYRGMVLGVHVMRAVSALMVAGAIAAIYFTALAIRQSRTIALLAAATAAVTPGVLLTSASVNNDNAAILTGSLALMAAVKALMAKTRRWPWVVLYGAMLLLAVQSKASTYFLLPLSLLLGFLLVRDRGRRAVLGGMLALLAIAVLGGLALQSARLDILNAIRQAPDALRADWNCNCTMFLQHYWGAIPNLWETYWGSYGWETFHPPPPMYRPFTAITILGVAGLLWVCWRKMRGGSLKKWLKSRTGASLVLLAAGFFVLLVMVDYRVLLTRSDGGTTHARFLFPAFAASTIFLVLGLDALRPDWLRKASFGLLFASCLSLVGFSIEALPKSFGPIAPVYGDAQSAGVQNPVQADFSNGMQLLGWNLVSGQPVKPGQTLQLRLFWGAGKPPDFDYSAFVRLDDGKGLLVHDSDHGPGQGIDLLSHAWQPGEVVPDDWTLAIPAGVHPGTYRLEVGLYDYRDLKTIAATDNQQVLQVGDVSVAQP